MSEPRPGSDGTSVAPRRIALASPAIHPDLSKLVADERPCRVVFRAQAGKWGRFLGASVSRRFLARVLNSAKRKFEDQSDEATRTGLRGNLDRFGTTGLAMTAPSRYRLSHRRAKPSSPCGRKMIITMKTTPSGIR